MGSLFVLFGYFAPDVVLPVASALAGAVGFVMVVGRARSGWLRGGIRARRGHAGGIAREADPERLDPAGHPEHETRIPQERVTIRGN